MSNDDSPDVMATASSSTNADNEQSQQPQHWSSIADRLNPNRAAFDKEFQQRWKTLSKGERKKMLAADRTKIKALKERGHQELPFEAETEDHCETSPTAYGHIIPLLQVLAKQLDKDPAQVRIYDPYYCAGGTIQHLTALGFPQVYNKAEDFYKVVADQQVPEHDVVVTNPPYSGDHFDRLLTFLEQNQKPFLLLLPSHFTKRPAYQKAPSYVTQNLVFVTPPERYHYWTPEGRRRPRPNDKETKRKHRNLHLGSRNSPFCSYWFVSFMPLLSRKKVLKLYRRQGGIELPEGCTLHGQEVSVEGAQQAFRLSKQDSTDSGKDKPTKKRRKGKKKTNKIVGDGVAS